MIILQRLHRQNLVVSDDLVGTQDGSNQTFYTTYDYDSNEIMVFYNGQALQTPEDFSVSGPNEITFVFIMPLAGENLKATYALQSS
jgi:hypothetical protein